MPTVGANQTSRRHSAPADDNVASKADKHKSDGPGGVGGARPRASSTSAAETKGPFTAITKFFARAFGGASPRTEKVSVQADNRKILWEVSQGKESPFSTAVGEALTQAKEDLSSIPNAPKDLKPIEQKVSTTLRMNPSGERYTPETLKSSVQGEIKLEVVKSTSIPEMQQKLGALGAPSDEGSISTLLISTKQKSPQVIENVKTADKGQMPSAKDAFVKAVVQLGVSQKNYTESKHDLENKAKEMLSDITDFSDKQKQKELKACMSEYAGKAEKLEDALTEGNGGIMPIIAHSHYNKLAEEALGSLGVRLGIY